MQIVCCEHCAYSGTVAFNNLIEKQESIDEHHKKVWRECFLSARKSKDKELTKNENTINEFKD